MSDLAAMAERHESLLTELGQLGMALARDLQARAVAAADTKEAAEMALAFQRVSRSLRQTFALEAKLARALHSPEAEAAELAARYARIRRRHAQVTRAVEARIRTECHGDTVKYLTEDLREMLGDAVQDDDFADETLEAHIARLCADLGLGVSFDEPDDVPPLDGEGDAPGEPGGVEPQAPEPPPVSAPASDNDASNLPTEGEGKDAPHVSWRSSA